MSGQVALALLIGALMGCALVAALARVIWRLDRDNEQRFADGLARLLMGGRGG